jgi:mannose-6-phosphate isomerase-like protein (cupin superfamily)
MPDFAITNLLELDDSMVGRTEGIEGRFGRRGLACRDLGVSHWRYAPGRRLFNHRHREQEEVYIVLSGSGSVRLDDEVHEVGPYDAIRVGPDVVRAFEAGLDGLELIIVGGPKGEGEDGVPDDSPWPGEAGP